MHYTLEIFEKFLKEIDLNQYRQRFTYIKTVEMDLPRNIQALDTIYEIYWDVKEGRNDKPLSFDEYYDYYYQKNKKEINEFWGKTGFGNNCDCFLNGLKARIYRTWASLITQIHAGYVAESVFGKDAIVEQSTILDHSGIDILIKYKNQDLKIQIKKESTRPEIARMHSAIKNDQGFYNIWYIVPKKEDYENPYYVVKSKAGQLREALKTFIKFDAINGTLDRLENGFVIFTSKEFEIIKSSID